MALKGRVLTFSAANTAVLVTELRSVERGLVLDVI
jgi:hypothetical protein